MKTDPTHPPGFDMQKYDKFKIVYAVQNNDKHVNNNNNQ